MLPLVSVWGMLRFVVARVVKVLLLAQLFVVLAGLLALLSFIEKI